MMTVVFPDTNEAMVVSDIVVTEDKDGYFTAQQTDGDLRAVSRDPIVAVAYLLEIIADALKGVAKETGMSEMLHPMPEAPTSTALN